jgi:hypothetical protein
MFGGTALKFVTSMAASFSKVEWGLNVWKYCHRITELNIDAYQLYSECPYAAAGNPATAPGSVRGYGHRRSQADQLQFTQYFDSGSH